MIILTGYILKRLGQSCIVIILVSLFAFSLVYLMPGDPVYALVGEGVELTEEEYQAEYIRLGLDRPVYERYADWVVDVLHGLFFQPFYVRADSLNRERVSFLN